MTRRVLLLGPPLALAALSAVHPRPEVAPEPVMEVATWFATFHLLQLGLVGLVAVSVLVLADAYGAAAAWSTRLGLGLFVVVFSAYDAVAGVATGLAMRTARDLPPAQQEGVWQTVKDWPALAPVPFGLNIVATVAWLVALVGIALAARRAGAARAEWILIAFTGVGLLGGHPFPAGTFAFGCLFAAACLHARAPAPALEAHPALGTDS
jgi:hypothetical protein